MLIEVLNSAHHLANIHLSFNGTGRLVNLQTDGHMVVVLGILASSLVENPWKPP